MQTQERTGIPAHTLQSQLPSYTITCRKVHDEVYFLVICIQSEDLESNLNPPLPACFVEGLVAHMFRKVCVPVGRLTVTQCFGSTSSRPNIQFSHMPTTQGVSN